MIGDIETKQIRLAVEELNRYFQRMKKGPAEYETTRIQTSLVRKSVGVSPKAQFGFSLCNNKGKNWVDPIGISRLSL
jgi:hypothetical protein